MWTTTASDVEDSPRISKEFMKVLKLSPISENASQVLYKCEDQVPIVDKPVDVTWKVVEKR
ncbi:hypothetical protein, partial [Streptomyces fildesensis]|uniref:hypothetical protein n=1 Tax=Streptomyces fildesensis TaxID=375757 RepID=UPI001E4A48A2